eukprot:1499652-Amphidinium_carterae.3
MSVRADYRFRRTSHINVQEMLAYRTALKVAAQRPENWRCRVPFMIDSQVVANVIHRGRSTSHQLNYVLQTCLSLCLFTGIIPLAMWIGTEENPADDPTRGHALRPTLEMDQHAWNAVIEVSSRFRWACLVTKAQWSARKKAWDSTLGYPGEGPSQRTLPPENQGRDLRIRVTSDCPPVWRKGPRVPKVAEGQRLGDAP